MYCVCPIGQLSEAVQAREPVTWRPHGEQKRGGAIKQSTDSASHPEALPDFVDIRPAVTGGHLLLSAPAIAAARYSCGVRLSLPAPGILAAPHARGGLLPRVRSLLRRLARPRLAFESHYHFTRDL